MLIDGLAFLGGLLGFSLLLLLGGDDGPQEGGDPVDEYIRMKKRRES